MTFCLLVRRRRAALSAGLLLCAMAGVLSDRAAVAAEPFPFDEELLLDARPMRGSKRVPMLNIRSGGGVVIDLWCNSVEGQLVVAADTITVLTGARTDRSCSPERERGDQDMLSALEQATNWRREGDTLLLIGPRKLRFHRATN